MLTLNKIKPGKLIKLILNIFKGFWYLFLDNIRILTPKQKKLYKFRLDVCNNCKYKDKNFCKECGCYIPAKVRVDYDLDEHDKSIDGCPKKYW